jgi:hypothetical protein
MASHHMTASVVASTQPQTHVGLQGVQHNYSHYPCTVVGGGPPIHQENNNYYEHQLSAGMHTGSYGVGLPISGGEMGQQQPQQPLAPSSGGGGGSSPSSGGQRTSPVTSSIAQSAHGMSNSMIIIVLIAKLYISSTLNIDLILWHPQLIVDAVKC